MFCVACMIFPYYVAVQCAMALCFNYRNKKNKESVRTCVCSRRFVFSEYGLYMFCVARMTFAHDVAVQFAMALLFRFRTCVCRYVMH